MDATARELFLFALGITAPIFMVLFLGMLLAWRNWLSDEFIRVANQLIYKIGLPMMLFTSCATSHIVWGDNQGLIIAFAVMTLLVFIGSWCSAVLLKQGNDIGTLVQGSFRGNLVILGLAFTANAYGDRGLAMATLPVAFTVVIYNILSVYILDRSQRLSATLKGVATNPLIIAIALGWIYNASHLPLPSILKNSAGYITQMVLPLALLCIGGSLSWQRLVNFDGAALSANLWKLILSPLIACSLGIAFGVKGEALIILFLLASAPTATVSYVMAATLGGNGKLAAAIIAQTTVISLFTITAGLMLLSFL